MEGISLSILKLAGGGEIEWETLHVSLSRTDPTKPYVFHSYVLTGNIIGALLKRPLFGDTSENSSKTAASSR
jgi:hypothetical protein